MKAEAPEDKGSVTRIVLSSRAIRFMRVLEPPVPEEASRVISALYLWRGGWRGDGEDGRRRGSNEMMRM